jgi:NAD(P)-dependent dehydrogenase (short-subunit alcohol dehydrogenase family)
MVGLGLVQVLAHRDNVVIFAGARDPSAATDLHDLVKTYPGKVHIVKLTSTDEENNRAAVEEIRRIAGRLDVVIANAGTYPFSLPRHSSKLNRCAKASQPMSVPCSRRLSPLRVRI